MCHHCIADQSRKGDDSMRLQSWLGRPKSGPTRRRANPRLSVEMLEDRSQPSFLAPVNYPVGANAQPVLTGDFNGDGKLDIAVANFGDSTVSVLLGNGDGTF